ncbi:hypothetical protein V1477_005272 [Vespula maculifrons]|uniref:Uncharacterized protein n=2 Tax=Vespula TaxID=7451 RepID=A0A834KIW9_VESVU|nr:hypothetical protein HZH66_001992 [Vespula vulgaris]
MFPKGRKSELNGRRRSGLWFFALLTTKVPACTEGATEEEEGARKMLSDNSPLRRGITSSPLAYSLLIHAGASWNTSESNGEGQDRTSNRKEELYEEGKEYVDFYLWMLTSAINSPIG